MNAWQRTLIAALTGLMVAVKVPAQTTSPSPPSDLDFTKLIPKTLPRSTVFSQPGWCLWDPCVVPGGDGLFYLFYSRWPAKLGFDAWCTHAEIAWATSTNAGGPYIFRGTALPTRGANFWDGHSVFNTCVVPVGGKFYLYYTGNRGTTNWAADRSIPVSSEEWWTQRNTQRIGVAVADSPAGPWRRSDKPLLEVGPGFGQTIINVPNLVLKPDGGYRLYYKTLGEGPGRFGSGVFHYGADASSPLGPFVRHPEPMVNKNKLLPQVTKPFDFHIDDHFEWFQGDRYYAIVKDHDAPFLTEHGRSLLLFESPDGRAWRPARHTLVQDFAIQWADGARQKFSRLEMPKLLLEGGRPKILSLAALPESGGESFLVLVPLLSRNGMPTPASPRVTRDFTTTGEWAFSSLAGHEPGAGSIYSKDKEATALWQPGLRSVNPVRLSLYLVTHPSNTTNAVVEIFAGGKTNVIRLDMRTGEPRWVTLGTFHFTGKGEEFIRVLSGGRGNVRLSALKLEVMDAKDGSVWQTLVLDDVVPYNPAKLQQAAPKNLREGPPHPEQWELTFRDEFNGDRFDTNVWVSAQGQSWGQLLSARFPENVVVTNGLLRLVTKKEQRGGKEWTSAMISTRKFRQKYGYWESRYRYAPATGLNQAFWMNPGAKDKTKGFEIDVNEGHYPTDVNATLHQSELPSKSKRFVADYDLGTDFHLYAAEWNEQEVIFYFDGQEIHRVPNTKAHLDVPVIFATAVLPWAGPINDSLNGASMDVDWVRVYQKK